MHFLIRLHNAMSRPFYRRTTLLVQFLVIVFLAMPAFGYEVKTGHQEPGVSITASAADFDHGQRPCCPDENRPDSDDCSTCSYCPYNAPLVSEIASGYAPAAGRLVHHGQPATVPDVHIPIFVPPQILA